MTQKELLYLEDAIGHEDTIIKICEDAVNMFDDDELISFMQNEINNHNEIKSRLLNMLEEKANG